MENNFLSDELYVICKYASELNNFGLIKFLNLEEVQFFSDIYNEILSKKRYTMAVDSKIPIDFSFGKNLVPFANSPDGIYCIYLKENKLLENTSKFIICIDFNFDNARVIFDSIDDFFQNMLDEVRGNSSNKKEENETSQFIMNTVFNSHITDEEAWNLINEEVKKTVLPNLMMNHDEYKIKIHESTVENKNKHNNFCTIFHALTTLYKTNSNLDFCLNGIVDPMNPSVMEKIENDLDIDLPEDLKKFLSCHQYFCVYWGNNFIDIGMDENINIECKRLNSIIQECGLDKFEFLKLSPYIGIPNFGKNGLLPIGNDGNIIIAYNLSPLTDGQIGQIIECCFEESTCRLIAKNLEEFMNMFLSSK